MKVKAIVLDIDGTLLNSQKEISAKTKNALINAQKQGVKLILASGRPTSGMYRFVEELDLDVYGGLLASYNGSIVTDCQTNNILFNQAISVEKSKQLLAHIEEFDVIPMVTNDEFMYVHDVYHNELLLENEPFNIIEYEARGGNFKLCEVDKLSEFVDFGIHKLLIAGDPEYLQQHYQAMQAPFLGEVSASFSAPFYFEFTDKGVDKAKALGTVLEELNISKEDVLAFGDGHNDYTMLAYAGTGIAMGNAVEELKVIADEITKTNDEDGIAVALNNYV